MSEHGTGVIHGDPVAMILLTYMAFILIFWLSQANVLNPISCSNTCVTTVIDGSGHLTGSQFNSTHIQVANGTLFRGSTIPNQYSLAYNNTKWFLTLFAPLGGYLIFNTVRARLDEEEGVSEEE